MDEPAFWGDDELEGTTLAAKFQQLERCAHCHKKLIYKRYCYSCKKKFPNSPTKALRKRIMEDTQNEVQLYEKDSDQGFYSDSWSDNVVIQINGPKFSNLPSAKNFHSTDSSPSTDSDIDILEEKKNARLQRSPRAKHVSSDSSMSTENCVACGLQAADTCVMHHTQRHLCFCLDCATRILSSGSLCPVCSQPIVYIYKYDNI